jgi:hypothetical protein
LVVGSTGGHIVTPGGVMEPNWSAGAAWTSTDGVTWSPGTVDGSGEQVDLREVFVGADGLTVVGTLTGGHQAAIWTSSEGTEWTLFDPGPDEIVERIPVAGNGTVILATSYRFDDDHSFAWWASTDGVAWSELAVTGETATAPRWDGGVAPDVVRLVAGTLVVLGQDGDHEVPWLARPVPELPPSPQVGLARPSACPTAGMLSVSDAYREKLAGGDQLGLGPRPEDAIDASDLVVVGRAVGWSRGREPTRPVVGAAST